MRCARLVLAAALATAVAAEMALVQPKELATQVAAKSAQPVIIQVGPNVLYRSKHIPGSIYAGPGSKPEGLEALKQAVAQLPHDRQIVLYCGCCPWDKCPNIRSAIEVLQQMGYTQVKALYVATNFKTDWIDQGYPVEEGTARE